MAASSTGTLVDAVGQYRLLEPAQLEEVTQSLQARFTEPKMLAGELIRRGWLTPFQANQLLQGRGQELVLGSYILLERLGEGGMGQVFKARHRNLGRIVALKLIRKERLDNPDAVRRFEREVRSAAALSHPNIVLAYDADQIDGTHLLVMEYVEGATDLAKLVKKHGPLPVVKACEYIKQTALGLQHAYERGMVHRDIKPANLLLTTDGKTVKILDMGLARLNQTATDDDKSSTMTHEGAVMGTPDYIAPEQAVESHTVDIRADLYSLGCTFYYLLAGRVPFPTGSLIQKINKHQFEEPQAVERLRPDVPSGVARVVRKLMAKKPENRYQTPAEVVAALAEAVHNPNERSSALAGADQTVAQSRRVVAVTASSDDTFPSAFSYMAHREDTAAVESPQRLRQKQQERRWLLLGVAGSSFVLMAFVVILFLAFKGPAAKQSPGNEGDHPIVVETPSQRAPATVDHAWLEWVAGLPVEKQVEAVIKKLRILNPRFDGKASQRIENGVATELQFITDNVTDISPVRVLTGLRTLACFGSALKGQLADLTPLKGMPLTSLNCSATQVGDLLPLKGMPLTVLAFNNTQVGDLSPLKGMLLTELHATGTKVADLSPLLGMPLTKLDIRITLVADLSPLEGMPLTFLECNSTRVGDLLPLKGMPLNVLSCDFKPFRDTEFLRSIKTLEKINDKPATEFWKEIEAKEAAFDAWCKQVAALPAKNQVEAVAKKLQILNPGFDGKVTHRIEDGAVTELQFRSDNVMDIAPVKALMKLQKLECVAKPGSQGAKLKDLSPLKGMSLRMLTCRWSSVADLSPLQGMPLAYLDCGITQVPDLLPLKGMPLANLQCRSTRVSDLSPLKGMPLAYLECQGTKVSDLSPLRGMPLTYLNCGETQVADLSPLKDMKLTSLMCANTAVSDLSPLIRMPLATLNCGNTQVFDLSPLKGMPLTSLECFGTKVNDLSPLQDMKLTFLHCYETQVSDLSPLRGMPLKELRVDFKGNRDANTLRSIKTLERINDKPAAEFWKEVEAKQKENR